MVEAQLPWHHCPWMLQPESCSSCSPLLCWGARLSLCGEGDTAPPWLWWLTHHRAESIAAAPRSSTGKQMHGQQTNPHWQASASGSAGTPTMNIKETSIFNILGEREKKAFNVSVPQFPPLWCVKGMCSSLCLSTFNVYTKSAWQCTANCDLLMIWRGPEPKCHLYQLQGECHWQPPLLCILVI